MQMTFRVSRVPTKALFIAEFLDVMIIYFAFDEGKKNPRGLRWGENTVD